MQEWAVHQKEGLLRDGGHEPARTGRVRHGEVKGAVETVEILSVDEAVDRPSGRERLLRDRNRRTADGRVEHTGAARIESRIASKSSRCRLNRHKSRFSDRVQSGRSRVAPLLIGTGKHDPPVQRLDGPARGDKFTRQVIEQFGMTGRIAAHAEIAGRGDKPFAEMPLPDTVDQHPGRQWVPGSAIARASSSLPLPCSNGFGLLPTARGGIAKGSPAAAGPDCRGETRAGRKAEGHRP